MKSNFHAAGFHYQARRFISIFIVILLLATPLLAQRPTATPAKPQPQREAIARTPEPTFENLLGADIYKVYGEVRNVGQLLSTGGAGEIVDPIIKLADPPQQFKAIVKFLKSNGEALADTRLFFASWPVHPDVPSAFVTIEFPTPEEAAKFEPKLETFLPTIIPPVPEESESKPNAPTTAKPTETKPPATPQVKDQSRPTSTPAAQQVTERLQFVISH